MEQLWYSLTPSEFGVCLVGVSGGGVFHLSFMDDVDEAEAQRRLGATWPGAVLRRDDDRLSPYVKRVFSGDAAARAVPLVIRGTPFQKRVWEALRAIPVGETMSYAAVARAVGSPKAVRAVGAACGRNPITWLIPCHRVIAANGSLGGYSGGLVRKKAMLAWEAARV